MEVKIVGPMTKEAEKLMHNTAVAIKKLKAKASFEKVCDVRKAFSYGIMAIPALVIDEQVISTGTVLSVEEAMNLIQQII